MHSWTTLFELIWREGQFDHSSMPFANSTLHIRLLPGRKLQPGRKYTIEIYKENGLRAQVGLEDHVVVEYRGPTAGYITYNLKF